NNLLYDNHASGISLYQIDGGAPSTGNQLYNNTIINASDARWCVNITDGCTGNQVLNNILINQHPFRGSIVIAEDALDGFVSDYNLVVERLSPDGDATILDLVEWQALGYDANSQVADAQTALFTAPQSGDFHALDATAQMVDAGTAAVSDLVAVDLEGIARPQGTSYDIGCFEDDINTSVATASSMAASLDLCGGWLVLGGVRAGCSVEWIDASGRRLAAIVRVQGEDRVAVPEVPWCMAVVRSGSGEVIARRRVALAVGGR
ncbi:MAG: hypothetical protein KA164_21475, partial [Rhodoferax sp.]|nr:hypothetical protein [Rhodoferax sp.]